MKWRPASLFRSLRTQAPDVGFATHKHSASGESGAGVKRIAHLSPKNLFELAGGLSGDRDSLLAENVDPVAGDTRRAMTIHLEIVVPLLLAILDVEAGQYARGSQGEHQFSVAGRTGDVR